MTYAKGTSVSVERTKNELDKLLAAVGAGKRSIGYDEEGGYAVVGFELGTPNGPAEKLAIMLRLPMPIPSERRFAVDHRGRPRTIERRRFEWEQACRERWRGALLLVKAKLEAVRTGTTTLEREFLADIRLADGSTVHQVLEHAFKQPGPLQLGAGS